MANEDLDPLDDTRIHPESYPAAIALARELRSAAGMSDEEAVEHALAEPRVSGGESRAKPGNCARRSSRWKYRSGCCRRNATSSQSAAR